MKKLKVFFSLYDRKTQKNQIICREADIKDDGTAIINLGLTGRDRFIERKLGDWLEAENFNVFWRRPLEEKAQVIANKILEKKEKKSGRD